jgi:NADH:ubiquinone oxidoreductase subunit 5 (subunit L)/multisubunit Na+/H+ antiporter MnhA subunit
MKPGWERLFASGFYLDVLYLRGIARPYQALSRFLWTRLDQGCIDWGSDETANFFLTFSKGLGQWTTGRLSVYLNMILLGFVVVIALLALGGHYF